MSDQQPVTVNVHNHMPAPQAQVPPTVVVQNNRSILQDFRDGAIGVAALIVTGGGAYDYHQNGDKSLVAKALDSLKEKTEIKVDARPVIPKQKTFSAEEFLDAMQKRDSLLNAAQENKADSLSTAPVEVAPEAPAVSADSLSNVAQIQTIKMKI